MNRYLAATALGLLLAASAWGDITSVATYPAGQNGDVQFNQTKRLTADSGVLWYSTGTKNLYVPGIVISTLTAKGITYTLPSSCAGGTFWRYDGSGALTCENPATYEVGQAVGFETWDGDVLITSPTVGIRGNADHFVITMQGGATSYWSLNPSSVTLLGSLSASSPVTLTGSTFGLDKSSVTLMGPDPALGGDLSGTIRSAVVTDDSHAHTTVSISGLDISADTNLAASPPIVLVGDTVTIDKSSATLLGPTIDASELPSDGYANTYVNATGDTMTGSLTNTSSITVTGANGMRVTYGVIAGTVSVTDDAYDATSWNGSTLVPTKNAIRDKIESLSAQAQPSIAFTTGTSAGYVGVPITSPTAVVVFNQSQVIGQKTGGSTFYWSLDPSSVTLAGQSVIRLSDSLQAGATFHVTSGTVAGTFRAGNVITYDNLTVGDDATVTGGLLVSGGSGVTIASLTPSKCVETDGSGKLVSASDLCGTSSSGINNQSTYQTGAQFYVSTGTYENGIVFSSRTTGPMMSMQYWYNDTYKTPLMSVWPRNANVVNPDFFIGQNAGRGYSGGGAGNVGVGPAALEVLTTGAGNVAIGNIAGSYLRTGSENIIIGQQSNVNSETYAQSNNVFIGGGQVAAGVSTNNNTIVGYHSGWLEPSYWNQDPRRTIGEGNIMLGIQGMAAADVDNTISIGNWSVTHATNSIGIGYGVTLGTEAINSVGIGNNVVVSTPSIAMIGQPWGDPNALQLFVSSIVFTKDGSVQTSASTGGGGGTYWGTIGGTISDQTDLMTQFGYVAASTNTLNDRINTKITSLSTGTVGVLPYQVSLSTAVMGTLPAANVGNGLTDAQVADDVTLTNITQITNRSHTSLSDIGVNTHAQIDARLDNIATSTNTLYSQIDNKIVSLSTGVTGSIYKISLSTGVTGTLGYSVSLSTGVTGTLPYKISASTGLMENLWRISLSTGVTGWPTCTGTDKLTANGSTVSCATDQTSSGSGDNLGNHVATMTITANYGVSASTAQVGFWSPGDGVTAAMSASGNGGKALLIRSTTTAGGSVVTGIDITGSAASGSSVYGLRISDLGSTGARTAIRVESGAIYHAGQYAVVNKPLKLDNNNFVIASPISLSTDTVGIIPEAQLPHTMVSSFTFNQGISVSTAVFSSSMTLSGSRMVRDVAPSDGQVLKWSASGSYWQPATDETTSSLEVFAGTQRSSPTATIRFPTADFSGSVSGSTMTIMLSTGVARFGNLVNVGRPVVVSGAREVSQSSATYDCSQFSGADAGAQINACIAAVAAVGGGIADARGITGVNLYATPINYCQNTSGSTKLAVLYGNATFVYNGTGDASYAITPDAATNLCRYIKIIGQGPGATIFTVNTSVNASTLFRAKYTTHVELKDMSFYATGTGGAGTATNLVHWQQGIDNMMTNVIVQGNRAADVAGTSGVLIEGDGFSRYYYVNPSGQHYGFNITTSSDTVPAAVSTALGYLSYLGDGNSVHSLNFYYVSPYVTWGPGIYVNADNSGYSIKGVKFDGVFSTLNGLADAGADEESGIYIKGETNSQVQTVTFTGGASTANNMHGLVLDGNVARVRVNGMRLSDNGVASGTPPTAYQLALLEGSVSGNPVDNYINATVNATGTSANEAFIVEDGASRNTLELDVLSYDYTVSGTDNYITLTSTNGIMQFPATYTVATLPGPSSASGMEATVTDLASANSCGTGGGSVIGKCVSNGTTWTPMGDGTSGSSGSFQVSLSTGLLAGTTFPAQFHVQGTTISFSSATFTGGARIANLTGVLHGINGTVGVSQVSLSTSAIGTLPYQVSLSTAVTGTLPYQTSLSTAVIGVLPYQVSLSTAVTGTLTYAISLSTAVTGTLPPENLVSTVAYTTKNQTWTEPQTWASSGTYTDAVKIGDDVSGVTDSPNLTVRGTAFNQGSILVESDSSLDFAGEIKFANASRSFYVGQFGIGKTVINGAKEGDAYLRPLGGANHKTFMGGSHIGASGSNTPEFVVVSNSPDMGQVGVNISTPLYNFHVHGDAYVSSSFTVAGATLSLNGAKYIYPPALPGSKLCQKVDSAGFISYEACEDSASQVHLDTGVVSGSILSAAHYVSTVAYKHIDNNWSAAQTYGSSVTVNGDFEATGVAAIGGLNGIIKGAAGVLSAVSTINLGTETTGVLNYAVHLDTGTTGQIQDGDIADGAVDGGAGGEIADGTITADDLGADSVSADELNASGVESELEAVLDLNQLQGVIGYQVSLSTAVMGVLPYQVSASTGLMQNLWKISLSTGTMGVLPYQVSVATGATGTLPIGNGGTGLTSNTDDDIMVGNGSAWQAKNVPECTSSQKLQYTDSSNSFSCATDETGSSSSYLVSLSTGLLPNTTFPAQFLVEGTTLSFSSATFKSGVRIAALSGIVNATDGVLSAASQISDTQIADGAVDGGSGGEISDNSITADDIAANAVGNSEMADDAIGTAEMADADHGDFTYSGGVATLDAGVVSSAEMADADHGDVAWSGGVATVQNVAAANVAAGSLGSSVIASSIAVNAVGTANVADGTMTSDDLAADSVSASELNATGVESELEGVLDLNELQGQIGDAQIAVGAVDGGSGGEIADGSITADDLGADSVGASELASAAIQSGDVEAGDLPADGYAATYVNVSGDTMTGQLTVSGSSITAQRLLISSNSTLGGGTVVAPFSAPVEISSISKVAQIAFDDGYVTQTVPFNGYVMQGHHSNQSSPADSTTYWFGNIDLAPNTVANVYQITVPSSGTVIYAACNINNTGGGSSTSGSIGVAINGTQATISSSVNWSNTEHNYGATVSLAAPKDSKLSFWYTTPTWPTNPTNLNTACTALIQ